MHAMASGMTDELGEQRDELGAGSFLSRRLDAFAKLATSCLWTRLLSFELYDRWVWCLGRWHTMLILAGPGMT